MFYFFSRFRVLLSVIVVIAMLLPSTEIFVPSTALAQSDTPDQPTNTSEALPTPFPTPNAPTFDLVPEPTAAWVDPVTNAAAAEQGTTPMIDTEAGKTGVVVGAATATLSDRSASVQLGALQLSVARVADGSSQPLTVQAEVMPLEQANEFSPVGMAFTLAIAGADGVSVSATQQPLELTLDYSQIPMRYGGSFTDRLTLYRVAPCAKGVTALDKGESLPSEPCRVWEPLAGDNDRVNQLLTVVLTSTHTTPVAAAIDAVANLYLPLVRSTGGASDTTTETDEIYVLAAAASSQQGDYKATPFANVSEYQVSLTTGAFQTGYPIPLPPAANGLAPSVGLNYSSGSVDGMTTNKNNQPGWVGIGWSLESGYIERHLKPCNLSQAPGDFCLTGDNYSIVLNGVSSRLVLVSGSLYRLQNDPYWKVEKFTNGATGHPDTQKEYWIVTTPDGTQYRFGGEWLPSTEGGTDQNSAWFVPVYSSGSCSGVSSYWVCDKVWRWNLDRVEDTNGNVIAYFYDQESNYYNARTFLRSDYVRAGNLSRIEYGRRKDSTTIPTQVKFITEERCEGACVWPTNYPDTPGDLTCASSGTCTQNAPTFWSRKRLNYIEPQYYNQSTSAWVSVARYDLDYTFPTPPESTSEKKLWLNTITQKLGDGAGGLPAVQYGNTMLNNRKDYNIGAGVSPLYMPRLNSLTTQLGGVVSITYGQSHACPTNATGSFIRYPYDCFPAWFVNGSSSGWTLWNKW